MEGEGGGEGRACVRARRRGDTATKKVRFAKTGLSLRKMLSHKPGCSRGTSWMDSTNEMASMKKTLTRTLVCRNCGSEVRAARCARGREGDGEGEGRTREWTSFRTSHTTAESRRWRPHNMEGMSGARPMPGTRPGEGLGARERAA